MDIYPAPRVSSSLCQYLARNLLFNSPLDLYGVWVAAAFGPALVNPSNLLIPGFDGILFNDRNNNYEFRLLSIATRDLTGGAAPPAYPETE